MRYTRNKVPLWQFKYINHIMVACTHIRTLLYIILYLNILVHYISDTLLYQSSNKAVWQKSSFPKSR